MAPSENKMKRFSHKTGVFFPLQNNCRNLNLDFRMLWKGGGGTSPNSIAVHLSSDLDRGVWQYGSGKSHL